MVDASYGITRFVNLRDEFQVLHALANGCLHLMGVTDADKWYQVRNAVRTFDKKIVGVGLP
jgi:hypothetical protein